MDDIKMAMAETNPNTPAHSCHLLDKLPVELRLDIYKHTFEGSRVLATLAENADSSSEQHKAGAVLHCSKHFGLLLSCRSIYNEALDVYWSQTVLRLKSPRMVFGSIRGFYAAKFKIDTYCHRLCSSLPEAAKAHVRHVRGMVLPALRSTWIEENPSLTATTLLGTFKKLATCELTPTLAHPVDALVTHTDDPKRKGYSRFTTVWGNEPARFLSDRYGVTNTDEVAFYFRGAIKYWMQMDHKNVEVLKSSRRSAVCQHTLDLTSLMCSC